MFKSTLYTTLLFFFCWTSAVVAQQYQGFNSSNFSGITSIYENPANIADSRYLLDINLISADFNFNNNYIAFNNTMLSIANNPIGDTIYNDAFQNFRNDNFFEKAWREQKQTRIYQSLNVQGPSFLFTIGKNGFAITSGVRQYFHIDNIDPRTADFLLSELEDRSSWNVDLNNQKLNILGAVWSEFGIAYGREIINTGAHFLKGGIHLKALVAMYSAHFYADELVLNFRNDDTLRVRVSDVRFGYSDDMSYVKSDMESKDVGDFFANMFNKAGFAADFGFVYEWRPNHKKYDHPTKEGKQVHHLNKYKLKAGFSVADIGMVTFDRGNYAGNFTGFSGEWDLDTFTAATQGVEAFGKLMNDTFNMTTNREAFMLRLPTTISVQVDYNIWKWFYVNFSARFAIDQEEAPLKMHALNMFTLTPRFEMHQFDFGIPISVDGYTNVTAGLYARVGPLFVGSTNCWNMIAGPSMHGLNIYAGLKIPITFSKPKKPKDILPKEEPKEEPIVRKEPKDERTPEEIAAHQEEVEKKAASDKAWAAEQERLAREKAEKEKQPEPEPEPEPDPIPEPEPDPIPEPEPEPDPIPEPEPTPEPEYYKVKDNETAVNETRSYFQSGSAWIPNADRKKLDALAETIKSDQSYHIVIHGHTDNVGDPESNKRLATKRANAVKKYLIEQGVQEDRLEILAQGSEKPIAENDTEEGREQNRRVEVLLLKNK